MYKALLLILFVAVSTSCTSVGVKPWERGTLSKSEMQFGKNSMQLSFEDHTFFSKEGSSGGRGFSAGGCGCN